MAPYSESKLLSVHDLESIAPDKAPFFLNQKVLILSYFSMETYVVGTH